MKPCIDWKGKGFSFFNNTDCEYFPCRENGTMEDDFDYETIQTTAGKHKKNFTTLAEKAKEKYPDMLPIGAGTCTICETCTYPDMPCRFPDKSISSMEAYGLWVSKVCELSNVP